MIGSIGAIGVHDIQSHRYSREDGSYAEGRVERRYRRRGGVFNLLAAPDRLQSALYGRGLGSGGGGGKDGHRKGEGGEFGEHVGAQIRGLESDDRFARCVGCLRVKQE